MWNLENSWVSILAPGLPLNTINGFTQEKHTSWHSHSNRHHDLTWRQRWGTPIYGSLTCSTDGLPRGHDKEDWRLGHDGLLKSSFSFLHHCTFDSCMSKWRQHELKVSPDNCHSSIWAKIWTFSQFCEVSLATRHSWKSGVSRLMWWVSEEWLCQNKGFWCANYDLVHQHFGMSIVPFSRFVVLCRFIPCTFGGCVIHRWFHQDDDL